MNNKPEFLDPDTSSEDDLWALKVKFIESNHHFELVLGKLYENLKGLENSGSLVASKLKVARRKLTKAQESGDKTSSFKKKVADIEKRIGSKSRMADEVKKEIAETEIKLRRQKEWLKRVEHIRQEGI